MKSIVISAKYKGDNGAFNHGQSYMIMVSESIGVNVHRLANKGNRYNLTPDTVHYDSVILFLMNWEEITSYPTFVVKGVTTSL